MKNDDLADLVYDRLIERSNATLEELERVFLGGPDFPLEDRNLPTLFRLVLRLVGQRRVRIVLETPDNDDPRLGRKNDICIIALLPPGPDAQVIGRYAFLKDRGRVWVEEMRGEYARCRFDPDDGTRGPRIRVRAKLLDFNPTGWKEAH